MKSLIALAKIFKIQLKYSTVHWAFSTQSTLKKKNR